MSIRTLTNYSELFALATKTLEAGKTFTAHTLDTSKQSKGGYIEYVVTRRENDLESYRPILSGEYRERWQEVTLAQVVLHISQFDKTIESFTADPRMTSIFGKEFRLFQDVDEECTFVAIASDRVVLVFYSEDWDSLNEYYGTYIKPTRH